MDEAFRKLVDDLLASSDGPSRRALLEHSASLGFTDSLHFCDEFSVFIALEFARGELSFASGSLILNALSAFASSVLAGISLQIYRAFDAGEYQRPGALPGAVPWQEHTLPSIMAILRRSGHWPSA